MSTLDKPQTIILPTTAAVVEKDATIETCGVFALLSLGNKRR